MAIAFSPGCPCCDYCQFCNPGPSGKPPKLQVDIGDVGVQAGFCPICLNANLSYLLPPMANCEWGPISGTYGSCFIPGGVGHPSDVTAVLSFDLRAVLTAGQLSLLYNLFEQDSSSGGTFNLTSSATWIHNFASTPNCDDLDLILGPSPDVQVSGMGLGVCNIFSITAHVKSIAA